MKKQCPVCKYEGEPETVEKWNGIRGPGARVISRQIHCPKCGVKFYHDDAWRRRPSQEVKPA